MRRWRKWARAQCGVAFLVAGGAVPLAARPPMIASEPVWTGNGPPPALMPPCDQYDPFAEARVGRIALDSRDLVQRGSERPELRSFIETGSVGKVEVAVVNATPPGVVRAVSAVPEISRISPYFGERLKGVALDVALRAAAGEPIRVVVRLRQVCARHFRDTFLYY